MKSEPVEQFLATLIKEGINIEQIPRLTMIVKESPFVLRQLGIKSKTFSDWKNKGIVLNKEAGTTRTWVNFNLTEVIWIKMVDRLRGFGVSYEILKDIKDFYFRPFGLKDLEGNEDANNSFLSQLKETIITSLLQTQEVKDARVDKKTLKKIVDNIQIEELLKIAEIEINKLRFCWFDYIILFAATRQFQIRFYLVDHFLIPSHRDFPCSEELRQEINNSTFISVSLPEILYDLIENKDISKADKLKVFTEKELKLLELLKSKKKQEILLEGEKILIITKENLPVNSNVEKVCREYSNQSVTINIQDGKKVWIKREIRKLIDS